MLKDLLGSIGQGGGGGGAPKAPPIQMPQQGKKPGEGHEDEDFGGMMNPAAGQNMRPQATPDAGNNDLGDKGARGVDAAKPAKNTGGAAKKPIEMKKDTNINTKPNAGGPKVQPKPKTNIKDQQDKVAKPDNAKKQAGGANNTPEVPKEGKAGKVNDGAAKSEPKTDKAKEVGGANNTPEAAKGAEAAKGKPEAAKADKVEGAEKPKGAAKAEKPKEGEKANKAEKPEKAEKTKKGEKADKAEKPEKAEKAKEGEKAKKGEKGEKAKKGEKTKENKKGKKTEKKKKAKKKLKAKKKMKAKKKLKVKNNMKGSDAGKSGAGKDSKGNSGAANNAIQQRLKELSLKIIDNNSQVKGQAGGGGDKLVKEISQKGNEAVKGGRGVKSSGQSIGQARKGKAAGRGNLKNLAGDNRNLYRKLRLTHAAATTKNIHVDRGTKSSVDKVFSASGNKPSGELKVLKGDGMSAGGASGGGQKVGGVQGSNGGLRKTEGMNDSKTPFRRGLGNQPGIGGNSGVGNVGNLDNQAGSGAGGPELAGVGANTEFQAMEQ